MFQYWLFTLLQPDSKNFNFQQDGAPPHCHLGVRAHLSENVPQRWIGRRGAKDLTVCDFFLWGYVGNKVYAPPLSANIDGKKDGMTAAINAVNRDMLRRVREEFSYRFDVVRAVDGGQSSTCKI